MERPRTRCPGVARYLRGLELRIPVEATAARFAAARRTESQLAQMEGSHQELCTNVEKGKDLLYKALAINENCPEAIKTGEIKNQFGRKVAIVS